MSKPLGALWRDRFELDNPALENEAADPAVERLIAHRTQRLYADDPVPAPVLDTLIAAALSAATKSDLQQVSFIRIRDRALRERIGALLPGMPWIVQAPEFFVVCGDNRRIRRVCALRGLPYENDTMDAVLNATIDAAIAMQQMVCAAEIMGLGCCHISHVRDHVETIAEMLEIPDHVFPISGLCVGWPAREGFVSVRLAPSATIHTDRYDDSRLADEIDGYDRRRRRPLFDPGGEVQAHRPLRHARILRLVGGQGAPDGGRRRQHNAGLPGKGRLRAGVRSPTLPRPLPQAGGEKVMSSRLADPPLPRRGRGSG